jgi:formylglycine-generating enzyme required for sulfatase activity
MRASRKLASRLAPLVLVAACTGTTRSVSEGQIVLYVDTDAPLPAGPGGAAALFDRLRVDLYSPGAITPCPGCINEFEVDQTMFVERRASMGIVPPPGVSGYRARLRLFRRSFADDSGEPNAEASIDATVALPPVREGTITEVTVNLLVDDFGLPRGTPAAPVDPTPGRPAKSIVGTWGGMQRVECTGKAPDGALCIPGGAFWMGTPKPAGFGPGLFFNKPRLVVLAPFYMASTEVTVGAFRASGKTPDGVWSGSTEGLTKQDWCTFTTSPGAFEDFPLNCVRFKTAHDYCASLGGELPSEAQVEYVAGAMSGLRFPWGQDEPACDDAIFGRGGYGQLATLFAPCMPKTAPGGPAKVSSGKRDRVEVGGGVIVDLGGNLGELTRDLWNAVDEPCWKGLGVYHDPWCTTVSPSEGAVLAYRGGTWTHPATALESHFRSPIDPDTFDVEVGFRCVWPVR